MAATILRHANLASPCSSAKSQTNEQYFKRNLQFGCSVSGNYIFSSQHSSATKSDESVCWRKVFPKDPYLRRRSSTYTPVTSHQLSRWSLDMLMTGHFPHNQRPWEYTVSWYRTPERVLWLVGAAPKRKEDSGDLLSPWQQTGCQTTESDTSGRRACIRLCTKVPRCDSW